MNNPIKESIYSSLIFIILLDSLNYDFIKNSYITSYTKKIINFIDKELLYDSRYIKAKLFFLINLNKDENSLSNDNDY